MYDLQGDVPRRIISPGFIWLGFLSSLWMMVIPLGMNLRLCLNNCNQLAPLTCLYSLLTQLICLITVLLISQIPLFTLHPEKSFETQTVYYLSSSVWKGYNPTII